MSDSFFDMPAGYNDADLEMSELEDRGRRAAKRYRGFSLEQRHVLEIGEHVTCTRWYGPADDRKSYTVEVRSVDADEVGPILDYSVHGAGWHPTARAAREAWQASYAH